MARKREVTFTWTWVHETLDGAEGIDLEVTATVIGKHQPARWGFDGGTPPEYPDIDIVEALDSDGVDCLALLSKQDMDELQALAELNAADAEVEEFNDEMERRSDEARGH